MSQTSAAELNKEFLSLLKIKGKGWNVYLFQNQNKVSEFLCAHCNHICCDAVELGCDHNDNDEIELYCYHCLNELIHDNNGNCPINSHYKPIISISRAARTKIHKFNVVCPYSVQYSKINRNINKNNDCNIEQNVIDTIGADGDEKEGIIASNNKDIGCSWSGTLIDLINNTHHLSECGNKYNPTFIKNIEINKLKKENIKLQEIINEQKQQINELKLNDEENKNQINQLQITLNEQNILIHKLQNKQTQNQEEKKDNTSCKDIEKIIKIPLKYKKHRGSDNEDKYHPKGLLNNKMYISKLRAVSMGSDWIIYEYVESSLYIPTKFIIRNSEKISGIKEMNVSIGDCNNEKWYTFNPNPINVKQINDDQIFNIYGIDDKIIRNNNFKQIKIEFIKNHGKGYWNKFICLGFSLYGYQC